MPFPMTLGNLYGHSLIASLFKRILFARLCSCRQDFNWQSVARSLCDRLTGTLVKPGYSMSQTIGRVRAHHEYENCEMFANIYEY